VIRLVALGTFAFALLGAESSPAGAQKNCRKGKPCGYTCIARDKICRVESHGTTGGLTAADPRTTRRADGPRRRDPALPQPIGSTAPCTIARVVDGDTVECADGTRVRLLLVDAPERDQGPYGAMATRALKQLVPVGSRATLELDVEQRDRYGRLLAYVYAPDGRMANEEMVREGYALLYTLPPNVKYVDRTRAALEEAKAERRGLWSTSAFDCPPAMHRRRAC